MNTISRKWATYIFIISIGAVGLFIVLSLAFFAPQVTRFDTYQQAVDSGLISKGWIPDFLPKDAFNIIEQHDLDTSEVVVEFSFRQPFIGSTLNSFTAIPLPDRSQYERDAKKIGWNFKTGPGVNYFLAMNAAGNAVLAVNSADNKALYWNVVDRTARSD